MIFEILSWELGRMLEVAQGSASHVLEMGVLAEDGNVQDTG